MGRGFESLHVRQIQSPVSSVVEPELLNLNVRGFDSCTGRHMTELYATFRIVIRRRGKKFALKGKRKCRTTADAGYYYCPLIPKGLIGTKISIGV